jgi:hypothetical protein
MKKTEPLNAKKSESIGNRYFSGTKQAVFLRLSYVAKQITSIQVPILEIPLKPYQAVFLVFWAYSVYPKVYPRSD